MIINLVFGFILPWLLALLFVKNREYLFYLVPFSCAVALAFDDLGYIRFWTIYPFHYGIIERLPIDLGLYALYPALTFTAIERLKYSPHIYIVIASIIITLVEGFALLFGYVKYHNGWNIVATFFSYYIALYISYWYYKKALKRRGLV